MSVDVCTRVDGPAPPVEVSDFFERELPGAIRAHARLLVPGVATMAPRPLSIEVEGETWTPVADAGRAEVSVRPGPLEGAGGARLGDTLDWRVVLRSALDGRAPHVPGSVVLEDAVGKLRAVREAAPVTVSQPASPAASG